jgi:hypothetical protein
VTVACVARGSREAFGSGRQGWQLSGGGRDRGAVRTRAERGWSEQRYCSTGPGPIWCTVCFPVIETWHGARVDPSKQFLPLGPLPILNRIRVIKFGTTPL